MSEVSPIWGGNEGYGAGDDVKQSAMVLSTPHESPSQLGMKI